ncbi:RIP metalloprotease [soil metagenome]|nr:RIP metalloprotease [Trueperaceae bacterium]
MLTAVVFLTILMTAVLVHEFAHYLNARSVGVSVRAFSIGMGPVLWRRTWRGTEWRLSLLPLGGYVDLPGMAASQDEDGTLRHPDEGMATRSLPQKLWVLVGGVLANYALGTFLLAGAVTLEPGFRELLGGAPVEVHGAQVVLVNDGSLAESIGIRDGDVLLEVNELRDPTPAQVVETLGTAEGLRLVVVDALGAEREIEIAWPPADLAPGERPLLGIQLAPLDVEEVAYATALGESFAFGVRMLPEMVVAFVRGFGSALTGGANEDVAGPVGMVSMVGQAAQVGIAPVLLLAALINFSLAVFNLLPIPGLDGGRMLLATVVAVRGRPFRPGQEEAFHFVGIMAVLALIVLITVQELGGLLGG